SRGRRKQRAIRPAELLDGETRPGQLLPDLAPRIAVPGMHQPVVLTAQPIMRRQAQQEQTIWPQDSTELRQGLHLARYPGMIQHLEARHQVEHLVTKRKTLDAGTG